MSEPDRIDKLQAMVQDMHEAILGGVKTGPGLMEQHRVHDRRLMVVEERLERHSNRLYALEHASGNVVKRMAASVAQTIFTVVSGALAGFYASHHK